MGITTAVLPQTSSPANLAFAAAEGTLPGVPLEAAIAATVLLRDLSLWLPLLPGLVLLRRTDREEPHGQG